MRQGLIDSVNKIIGEELTAADEKFPDFHSGHEGWAVIREESDELKVEADYVEQYTQYLWGNVKSNHISDEILAEIESRAISAACEAIQVAAMCQKFKRLMK